MLKCPLDCREATRKWWVPSVSFRSRSKDYPMKMLITPYRYVVALMSRIYGEAKISTFKESWVPFLHTITTIGHIFNWAVILSSNLENSISVVKNVVSGKHMHFHMSSYLLDMVCQEHDYPTMGWRWKKSDLLIHLYCQDLWEHKYRVHYQKICNHFLISLFQLLFYT
jgi:hypothetical protein